MKDRWLKTFIKDARKVELTAREKRAALSNILGADDIPSPYLFFLTVVEYRHKIVATAMLVAIVVTSGGTSIAASGALPGEALYSIKVNINEEIQSFVAVTPNAKAKVGVKRTEKRLEEAKALSKEGKLNAETQAIIETNIDRHSASIKANIATLADSQATATVNELVSELNESVEPATEVATSTDSEASLRTASFSMKAVIEPAEHRDEHLDAVLEKVNQVKEELGDIVKEIEKEIEAEVKEEVEAKTEVKVKEEEKEEVEVKKATTTTPLIITTTTVTSTTTTFEESAIIE